jgi:putative endonuclease
MVRTKRDLGNWGEERAADFLRHHGFFVREKNVRTAYGEIDIVAMKDEMLIFVEVKTRQSNTLGPPEVSISEQKKERLIESAQSYVQDHPELGKDWQIDVISIRQYPGGSVEITHFENAIEG